MSITEELLAERHRQITAEGWSADHDDEHRPGDLAHAAACYAMARGPDAQRVGYWPWEPAAWKPKDWRRNLVRAGALIIAEIERLDRMAKK